MLKEQYEDAMNFERSVETATRHRELWDALRRRARVPPALVERVERLGGQWHLLALSEDWCGDAVNTLPAVAALADAARNLDLRVLARDANPDLMDAHLTGASRSIPVVMVLDERYRERGWWGPRPRELQAWVLDEGRRLPADERYRRIRGWYARDQGRTTLEELVSLLEGAAAERREAVA